MHGPESLPFRADGALPEKPFGSTSRIIQPNELAAIGAGVRAEPAVDRRRTGQARRVEEEVAPTYEFLR